MYFQTSTPRPQAEVDLGIQSFFTRVYGTVASGLVISAISAYFATKPFLFKLFYNISEQGVSLSMLGIIALIAPFVLIFMFNSAIRQLNVQKARALFIAFSVLFGISISSAFLTYSATSITKTFLITAGTFAGMSLYGYTTKRSLDGLGSFLRMGLWGIVLASIVNIFMKSSSLDFVVSIIGVGIFTGLTAYDTQNLKQIYVSARSSEEKDAMAVAGALSLYLDFVNLFLFLLRFFGDRK